MELFHSMHNWWRRWLQFLWTKVLGPAGLKKLFFLWRMLFFMLAYFFDHFVFSEAGGKGSNPFLFCLKFGLFDIPFCRIVNSIVLTLFGCHCVVYGFEKGLRCNVMDSNGDPGQLGFFWAFHIQKNHTVATEKSWKYIEIKKIRQEWGGCRKSQTRGKTRGY